MGGRCPPPAVRLLAGLLAALLALLTPGLAAPPGGGQAHPDATYKPSKLQAADDTALYEEILSVIKNK